MSGLIRSDFGRFLLEKSQLAMVKPNLIMMKQPELGHKILELRKAKGLTQEELVERCNINVRTIQRIEAGEVTPRSYTIKSIMDALEYDFSSIVIDNENEEGKKPYEDKPKDRRYLKTAFFAGIIYFMLALVEGIVDFLPAFNDPGDVLMLGYWYAVIKISVIITYAVFMWGFYRISLIYPNTLVMLSSIFLVAATTLTLAGDVYSFYTDNISFLSIQIFKAILTGAFYVTLGIGLWRYQSQFGSLALIAGVLGIISGVAFLTVIFALPGLIVFTVFEVFQLVLLFKVYKYKANEKQDWQSKDLPVFG